MLGRSRRPRAPAPLGLLLAVGLLAACTESSAPDDDLQAVHPPEIARIVPAGEALAGANIPMLDPSTMNDAEIRKALAQAPGCAFRYTTSGDPVLALHREPAGKALSAVVKLNGHLVPLQAAQADAAPGERLVMVSDPVRIALQPDPSEGKTPRAGIERREANMTFEVGRQLRVGYRGYLDCALSGDARVQVTSRKGR